jgi:hypothetical protein
MKIRELKRTAGQTALHAWPPMWTGSYAPGDKFAVGEVGTLKSVKSRGDHLILTIEHEAREASGLSSGTPRRHSPPWKRSSGRRSGRRSRTSAGWRLRSR